MFEITMIQHPTKPNRRQIIRLDDPLAYVAPAGYVVGAYDVVFPCLTRAAALKVLAALHKNGACISLWWNGAAQDIDQQHNQES